MQADRLLVCNNLDSVSIRVAIRMTMMVTPRLAPVSMRLQRELSRRDIRAGAAVVVVVALAVVYVLIGFPRFIRHLTRIVGEKDVQS